MSTIWNDLVTRDRIATIQTVVRKEAVNGAAASLAAWGGFNTLAWFLFGGDNRDLLLSMNSSDPALLVVVYAGLGIGLTMLLFSAIGYLTGNTATLMLDGLALLTVGAWNAGSDLLLASVLSGTRYHVESPNTIFIIMGICQIVFGLRQLSRFLRTLSWKTVKLKTDAIKEHASALRDFAKETARVGGEIVKATIQIPGPMNMEFMSRTVQYTGRITRDVMIMISDTLDDCLVAKRNGFASKEAYLGSCGIFIGKKSYVFDQPSVVAIKQWAGVSLAATDVGYLATTDTATLSVLEPFFISSDAGLRSAAVAALATNQNPEAAPRAYSFLGDADPTVRAAAITTCTAKKIDTLHEWLEPQLSISCPELKIAIVGYYAAFPRKNTTVLLEKTVAVEKNREVKKACQKVIKQVQAKWDSIAV